MADGGGFASNSKMHVIILCVVGLICVIAGIAVATIHSSLRGSGLGTVLLVLGVVLLLIAVWRNSKK